MDSKPNRSPNKKHPVSVRVTLIFVVINVLIWLIFSLSVATNQLQAIPDQPLIKYGVALLALIISGVMVGLYFLLREPSRIGYYLALFFFLAILFVALLDEVGVVDVIVLLINLIPVILLIKDRGWYLTGSSEWDISDESALKG